MANTYTQIHLQVVIVVKYRAAMISPIWKEALYQYMTGILRKRGHKLLAINGMPDHVHILFGMRPVESLSVLMQELKEESSRWINEKKLSKYRFSWQPGYGAFSYAKAQLPRVIRYIENQEEHHQEQTFREEYIALLTEFAIEFDQQYIFCEPSPSHPRKPGR